MNLELYRRSESIAICKNKETEKIMEGKDLVRFIKFKE